MQFMCYIHLVILSIHYVIDIKVFHTFFFLKAHGAQPQLMITSVCIMYVFSILALSFNL